MPGGCKEADQLFARRDSPFAIGVGEQDYKLVAAHPANYIGRTQVAAHNAPDVSQQLITGGVASGVVHRLQSVHVQVHHADRPAVPDSPRDFHVKGFKKRAACQATRQLIG